MKAGVDRLLGADLGRDPEVRLNETVDDRVGQTEQGGGDAQRHDPSLVLPRPAQRVGRDQIMPFLGAGLGLGEKRVGGKRAGGRLRGDEVEHSDLVPGQRFVDRLG
ncbi:hypothetical protein AB1484_01660 [Parafrankia sp. FMc6]|uniref:hypothetical protein n=1 Tax=Parafrankia soli TaxID=2599596 RepID=UPI0034D3F8CD